MRTALTLAGLGLLLMLAPACSDLFHPAGVDELVVTDLKLGDGKEAVAGRSVAVHYTGWLYDPSAKNHRGAYFDSSRARGVPFSFVPKPGSGGVIEGWNRGIPGMRVGGVRELIVPPELAYGDKAAGGGAIPPNSTLVFEVELLKVRD